jgi:hypothetical protein
MNPKTTTDPQDDTFAGTESESIGPTDELVEADGHPNEDIEDMDAPEDDDDRAGLL